MFKSTEDVEKPGRKPDWLACKGVSNPEKGKVGWKQHAR